MAGFNGRAFKIMRGTVAAPLGVIAAVRTKSATHAREAVDVTNDDDNGNRTLLPEPGVRSVDVQVEGVATVANYNWMLAAWAGNLMTDIFIQHPDGSKESAADGFFLNSLEHSGESAGDVAFTAQFMSSGAITLTPAP